MAFSVLKKVVDDNNNNKNIYRLLLTSLLQQQPNYYTLPTLSLLSLITYYILLKARGTTQPPAN